MKSILSIFALLSLSLFASEKFDDYRFISLEKSRYVVAIDNARWENSTIEWWYNPNNQPFETEETLQAIEAAMNQWENVSSITFVYKGITSQPLAINSADDKFVIGWLDDASFASYYGGGIGLSSLWFNAQQIVDAEMSLNIDKLAQYDIDAVQGTVTHEIGHILGLDHSDAESSIMYANPYHDYDYIMILRDDDIEAVQNLYPVDATRAFVLRLYQKVFDRTPQIEEQTFWIEKLNSEESAASVAKAFFRSAEFENLNVNAETFIEIAYQTLLNRTPDEEGSLYWLDQMLHKGILKDQIFYNFAFSPEFTALCSNTYDVVPYDANDQLTAFIERFYNLVLERSADQEGLAFWKNELKKRSESAESIAKAFFFSDEFVEKNYTDEEFITILYRTLLNREPDDRGMEYWLIQMSNGTTKENLIDDFLFSEEFHNIQANYGIL